MRRIIGLFAATLLFVSVIGCSKAHTWEEQYDLGIRYLSEGNYEEAVIAFTAAIEIDPNRTPAYIGRGDSYVGQASSLTAAQGADDNYNSAVTDYLAAIDLDPLVSKAYEKLSRVYIEQGDYDAAADILERGYEATKDEKLSEFMDMLCTEMNGPVAAFIESLERLRAELEWPLTVTGRIIYNSDEYRNAYEAYIEQHKDVSEFSLPAFGIRFEPAQRVITENGIEYVTEAQVGGSDYDALKSLVGYTAEFTGSVQFTGEAEFSGPYPPGTHNNNKFTAYWYNPNGPWRFTIESYEIVE